MRNQTSQTAHDGSSLRKEDDQKANRQTQPKGKALALHQKAGK